MTGATEATLADLLATAQAMNVNLIKLQNIISRAGTGGGGGSSSSTSSGGSPASSAASLLSSFNPLSMAFGVLKGVVSGISSVFGFLSDVVSTVIGGLKGVAVNLYEFAKSTAMGTSKLSEFYAAFSGFPVLGTFFGILSAFTAYQENLLAVYQKLTDSGASFGGSLSAMRSSAARAYMSMDDFTKIVQTNSDLFATMGGNVQSGIDKFVNIAGGLYGPKSKYGNMLAGLGYTAESAAETLALYMRMQGTMNKQDLNNSEKVTKGAAEYAEQLSTLSQLTGESNAELRKKQQKVLMEEAFQVYLSTLKGDNAKKIGVVLQEIIQGGGDEAAEFFKNAARGANVAQTKAQADMDSLTGGAMSKLNKRLLDAINAGVDTKELVKMARVGLLNAGNEGAKLLTQIGAAQGSVAVQQQMLALATLLKTRRTYQDEATLKEAENKSAKDRAKQASGSAAALEQSSKAIRSFGDELLNMIYGAIVPMVPFLKDFAQWVLKAGIALLKLVQEYLPLIIKGVNGVWEWFKNTLAEMKKAYTEKGWSGVFDVMGEKVSQLWDVVRGPLIKMFDNFLEFFKPYAINMVNVVEDYVNAILYKKFGSAGGEDPELRKQQRHIEKLGAEVNRLVRAAEDIQQEGNQSAIDAARDAARAKINETNQAIEAYKNANNGRAFLWGDNKPRNIDPLMFPNANRHSGTIGMTGSWWEKQDATLNVQAGESVVTPSQMAQLTGQNGVAEGIQRLNSLTAQLLAVMKQNTDYTQRNYNATKELGGNLFATV